MLKKGIVCIGCSHTWGGGLEWYSNHKDINERISDGSFDSKNISYATYKFICANRWSRLLANELNTWEVNRITNSGSEDGSVEWLKYIFSMETHSYTPNSKCYLNGDFNLKFDFDEIDYVILQLTDPFRNNVIYLGDKRAEINIAKVRLRDTTPLKQNKIENFENHLEKNSYDEFYKFYLENFSSYKEMEDYFCKQNLDLIEKLFKQLEEKGVKCRIWTWQKEYIPFLKQNEYLNNRYIKLLYENKEFDSLADLMEYNTKFMISKSDYRINGKKVNDDHQTIECHKVTANSIATYIKNEINNV